ncbi:hypothetical protein CDAR_24591 [Caerostris darwini]|uniref:Uncharacterized protein n=1 Tax=Caerostris darwini TaxID=1538125 RepID=A0AAV4UVQ3_9ARAC|nr:hypothetical protein CDAR_24591 [Caerostris darwini]
MGQYLYNHPEAAKQTMESIEPPNMARKKVISFQYSCLRRPRKNILRKKKDASRLHGVSASEKWVVSHSVFEETWRQEVSQRRIYFRGSILLEKERRKNIVDWLRLCLSKLCDRYRKSKKIFQKKQWDNIYTIIPRLRNRRRNLQSRKTWREKTLFFPIFLPEVEDISWLKDGSELEMQSYSPCASRLFLKHTLRNANFGS